MFGLIITLSMLWLCFAAVFLFFGILAASKETLPCECGGEFASKPFGWQCQSCLKVATHEEIINIITDMEAGV